MVKKAKAKKTREPKGLLILTSGKQEFSFKISRDGAFSDMTYPWDLSYDGNEHRFMVSSKCYKMPLKNWLARWRSQPLVERLETLRNINPKVFAAMEPSLKKDCPAKHKRFLTDLKAGDTKKDVAPKGYAPIVLRRAHQNTIVYIQAADKSSFFKDSFSLSDMNKCKPEGRDLVDALLRVPDPKIRKKNADVLSSLVCGSMSEKGNSITAYANEKLGG